MKKLKQGALMIVEERIRQLQKFGFDDDHDDDSNHLQELAWAAVCYAAPQDVYKKTEQGKDVYFVDPWPWPHHYDGREADDRITHLTKAGALIAAEIDRLQRKAEREEKEAYDVE